LFAALTGLGPSRRARATEAAPSFTLPAYQKVVLENGLTLLLMEQHEVPMIHVSAVFPAGSVCDAGRYGLAALTAESLLFGTRSYTKQQIEQELDFLGASCWTSASEDAAILSMSFVCADQGKIFPILKEVVCCPRFDRREIDKRKKQWLVELQRDKERPEAVIGSYFDRALFGAHPYGNPTSGTPESISRITVKDVQAFYKAHYDPNGSAVAVVGDFNTPAMQKAITALFADWRCKAGRRPPMERPQAASDKARVLLVNKDDAIETRFLIGGPGVARSHPDFVEIQVINTILGGRFTSWLNDELRINRGLTYGARSGFQAFRDAGTFTISSFTKTEHTLEALNVSLEVINRLHTQGVDQETLSSAQNYICGQFPTRFETAGSLANLLTDMFVYGFDQTYVNTFMPRVRAMTPEKAKAIIAAHFPKDHLQFVLIGKASALRDSVKTFGELTEKDIRTPGF
jgi:predicted Zn-dependent peptidase